MGIESTLTHHRNRGFLQLGSRSLTNKIVKNYIICNKYNCRSGKSPYPPNLPSNRVNFQRPFYSTGIDYTGHFFVTDGESKVKSYILIFTCCTRAVHLELVKTMCTDDFVLAFHECEVYP